jgi:hypothetical protein
MTALSSLTASPVVKMLYMGASGTGKTGSLVSLVKAGYHLRIIDMDNGLLSLVEEIKEQCPDKIDNVDFQFVRDVYYPSPTGPKFKPPAKAMIEIGKLLAKWPDGTVPDTWGPNHVLVVDSLTAMGQAARNFAESINPTCKDPRQWYKEGQEVIENFVATVTSQTFNTNVVVITHVEFRENDQGIERGFPTSLGAALGPRLPRAFNNMVMAETKGAGNSIRRTIRTVSSPQIDLKVPTKRIKSEYDLNTGLAEIFATLKG